MAGERDLRKLLAESNPRLLEGEFVFVSVPPEQGDAIPARARIDEDEGSTLVLHRAVADAHSFEYEFVARWITLTVHSALDAIGLTATFSSALADAGISCNVLAGYHHDHILVDADRAEAAMAILERMGRRSPRAR
ncbi:ACT domain-containing protein [Aldersonia kunmingensis]|uniref:ACT domain-containing protein n=1 Tax=Aldersonia kunmingensis TaxID=408066 RepID=UPI00082C4316|nr:ACT domain-containing protein [Aldersonia kunmingensis]